VGRVFEAEVVVRFGDTDPRGRLRLDALARLLQDVGNDDFTDAGFDPLSPWVARRSTVVAHRWPRLGDRLTAATWCGGLGGRWAERRSSLAGSLDVATLWVHVDGSGRPARIPEWFRAVYGPAAGGRDVSARLSIPPPPVGAGRERWPVRAVDLDVLGHVNNAVTWAMVEEACARRGVVPAAAELEYVSPIGAHDRLDLVLDGDLAWLLESTTGEIRAAARFVPAD
jgi:acyl-ACP thioesterase